MNELNNMERNNLTINPERLKYLSGVIKETIAELKIIKKNADDAWEECNTSLGDSTTKEINDRKIDINKKHENAISDLEHEAEVLESVSYIWNDTETEIMSSSKSIEDIFADLNKSLSSFFGNKR